MKKITKSSMMEFLRYVIVGGISSVVDMAINYTLLYFIFRATKDDTPFVIISVAAGFLMGLLVNFFLSNVFVFVTNEQQKRGKTIRAFLLSAGVGIIGLILSEILTVMGSFIIGEHEIFDLILICFVKCIVLFWNYGGRKIFVYGKIGKKSED